MELTVRVYSRVVLAEYLDNFCRVLLLLLVGQSLISLMNSAEPNRLVHTSPATRTDTHTCAPLQIARALSAPLSVSQ